MGYADGREWFRAGEFPVLGRRALVEAWYMRVLSASPQMRTASRMRRVPRASTFAVYSVPRNSPPRGSGAEVVDLIGLGLLDDAL